MNQNEIMAQQQAMLEQAMHQTQQMQFAILALWLAGLLITALVLYMFYARLRDISVEIRKFRIAYEFSDSRENRARAVVSQSGAPASDENPFSQPGDSKYQPKRS